MAESIRELKNDEELKIAFPLLQQLRPHLDLKSFRILLEAAKNENQYRLIGLFDEDELVALMGCRILHDFVNGRVFYIDDLVTDENQRSKGYGAKLLKHAEQLSRLSNCKVLRLSSGHHRKDAHRFYEREKWENRGLYFQKIPL